MPVIDLREASRTRWTVTIQDTNNNKSLYPGDENVRLGALMRIADATEVMAKNYRELINDRDQYKRWYESKREENKTLQRQVAALKGQITKLKKRLP